jgi:hypothetical protein
MIMFHLDIALSSADAGLAFRLLPSSSAKADDPVATGDHAWHGRRMRTPVGGYWMPRLRGA